MPQGQHVRSLFLALALGTFSLACAADDFKRSPLPFDHPLIGAWRIDVPGTGCHEVYTINPDGTTAVTSGQQAAESEFVIDVKPSPRGFYKWVDKLVKDNGLPDCMGSVMTVGHEATNFIIVHPSRPEFLMCSDESLSACIGPFRRIGQAT
ncbi:hypothetical protein ACWA7J_06565 [Leptothrix sp. BB-4]